VPLADADALGEAIRRVQQDRYGGTVEFEAPRAGILAGLAEIAAGLEGLHASERVHADLSPGNVLFTADAPVIFDSLDVVAGSPATTATFSWAAPEQIIGHPLDPRADVFALGKLATRILGGVPFGEQTHYVVPVGGSAARTVELLKCEGVFVDVSGGARSRPWQIAWQEFLGRCLAYDRTRRPESGRAFADGLRELLEAYPPTGGISFAGSFGQIVEVEQGGARGSARLCAD
jgi:serine/threonine protein kinase